MNKLTASASELPVSERYCTCCERLLTSKVVWLELDQRRTVYHDFGGVPADKSQGWFPFGSACAKRLRKEARG